MDLEQRLDNISQETSKLLAEQAVNHPYRTVLVAAGVGYVLGGGIPRWALRMGVSAGVRMALATVISDLVGE